MRTPTHAPELCTFRATDGYRLRGRCWRPQGPDRRHAILYLHGIQSHGGWYEWSGSVLSESGATVLMVDRRGSGLNRDARGDTPGRERWLADMDDIVDCLTQQGIKTIDLVGVSWGGRLVIAWAQRAARLVQKVLLVTPGIFPAVDLSLGQRLQVAGALLRNPGRMFPIPLSDAALFTDNPDGRIFIERDPLKLTHVTARFLWHSRRLERGLIEIQNSAITAPLTLFLAGRDSIIRNQPTQAWSHRIAGAGFHTQTFESAAHTLEFEPSVAAYEEALRAWSGAPR